MLSNKDLGHSIKLLRNIDLACETEDGRAEVHRLLQICVDELIALRIQYRQAHEVIVHAYNNLGDVPAHSEKIPGYLTSSKLLKDVISSHDYPNL